MTYERKPMADRSSRVPNRPTRPLLARPNAALPSCWRSEFPGWVTAMTDPLTFARGLLGRGIELILRGNRLNVWPAKAYPHLTDGEREFIREHREELKELTAARVLPETTVVWSAPSTTAPLTPPSPTCPHCGRVCVGESHWAYRTLHALDASEIERRRADATAVMNRQFGKMSPYL